MIEPTRKLSLTCLGEGIGKKLGNGETKYAVAKELQPLVVLLRTSACARARMSERYLEQSRVREIAPEPGAQIFECPRLEQGLMHHLEDARPADARRPVPKLPEARALVEREEDDLRLADEILKRHETDL